MVEPKSHCLKSGASVYCWKQLEIPIFDLYFSSTFYWRMKSVLGFSNDEQYVQGLFCLTFIMSRVCYVQRLLCLASVISWVCHVQYLSVYGLSRLVFVFLGSLIGPYLLKYDFSYVCNLVPKLFCIFERQTQIRSMSSKHVQLCFDTKSGQLFLKDFHYSQQCENFRYDFVHQVGIIFLSSFMDLLFAGCENHWVA